MHNFSGYNVTSFLSFNRLYSVSESEGAFSVVGSFTLGSREATVLTFSSGKSRNRQTQLPLTGEHAQLRTPDLGALLVQPSQG
jgi:hypothetical protein